MICITVANDGEVLLSADTWPRFVDAIAREIRQLATVRGAWSSHPADQRQDACWCVEVDPKNRALLRGLLIGVGYSYRQDIAWTPALMTEVLR